MISQALVEAKTSYGFSKAANALGASCGWFRPNGSLNPLASGNQVGTLLAYFRLPSGPFTTPIQYDKFAYLGAFDLTNVSVFDYLIEPVQGPFYIASLDPVSYPLCIRCNATLTFTRPAAGNPSSTYYSGDLAASELPLMTSWPAALIPKTRGETTEARLPGDTKSSMHDVFLPSLPGTTIEIDDVITDALGNRYTVSSVGLSALGWHLLCYLSVA